MIAGVRATYRFSVLGEFINLQAHAKKRRLIKNANGAIRGHQVVAIPGGITNVHIFIGVYSSNIDSLLLHYFAFSAFSNNCFSSAIT